MQTSYYPMGFVVKGADRLIEASDIKGGTVRYLAETLGLRQVGYRSRVSVRAPDATEALFFNVPQDGRVGVFEILETAFDQTGTPMRLTETIFPTDRNRFIVNVGEIPEDQPEAKQDLGGTAARLVYATPITATAEEVKPPSAVARTFLNIC